MPMFKEFKDFLLKQNVVALAIAVVVGTALNTLVKALVDRVNVPELPQLIEQIYQIKAPATPRDEIGRASCRERVLCVV